MAKDIYFSLVILISVILDLAWSLHLSQDSAVKNVGDTFVVICKDKERGQSVSWRGPNNNKLGMKTRPRILTSSMGTSIMFNGATEEDSGNYTCSTNNPPYEKKVFSLKVEETILGESYIGGQNADNSYVTTTRPNYHYTRKPTHKDKNIRPPVSTKIHDKDTNREETIIITLSPTTTEEPVKTTTEADLELIPLEEIFYEPSSVTTEKLENQIEEETIDEPSVTTDTVTVKSEVPRRDPLEFKDTPSVQTAVEGDTGILKCEVNKKKAVITWVNQDNEPIISPNDSGTESKYEQIGDGLLIRNVTRDDGKIYICEAIHKASGGFLRRPIKVVVQHKPYADYAEVEFVYGFLNEIANLTCEVKARPDPKFRWFLIQKRRNVSLTDFIIESNQKSVLQVNLTESYNDPITYKCEAINRHGILEVYFNVQVIPKPDPPTNITETDATSSSLQLEILLPEFAKELVESGMQPSFLVVEYRNETEEEWHTEEFNITSVDSVSVLLTDLEKNTTYEVQAATRNLGGLSDYITGFFSTTSASPKSVQTLSIFAVILTNLSILLLSNLWQA